MYVCRTNRVWATTRERSRDKRERTCLPTHVGMATCYRAYVDAPVDNRLSFNRADATNFVTLFDNGKGSKKKKDFFATLTVLFA
jgi:hypothetical protein